jgi:hypothetical protein
VASARLVKHTKKTIFCPVVTVTAVGMVPGASGSKVVATTRKIVVPAQKHRVPAIGVMVEASSTESQESSPHSQTARDSILEIVSMPEPHGQSPRASVPDTAPRAEPGTSLQITAPTSWLVILFGAFICVV